MKGFELQAASSLLDRVDQHQGSENRKSEEREEVSIMFAKI